MKITSITLEGFRSFSEPVVFKLPTTPGLYFMTGENVVEPDLEGNGAGKSTFWEALFWAFFGKTSRNLKAGDVCSWGAKNTYVEVEYEKNGHLHTLLRRWNPNKLTVDGEDVESTDALIGYGDKAFLLSVFMSQFSPAFMDLAPTEKTSLFGEILKLDHWLDYSKKADTRTSDREHEIQAASIQLGREEGGLAQAMTRNFSEQIQEWEAQQAEEKIKAHNNYEIAVNSLAELGLAQTSAATAIETLKAELVTIQEEVVAAEGELNIARGKMGMLATNLVVTQNLLHDAKEKAEFFKTSRTCPECKQEMGPRHRQVHAKTALDDVQQAQDLLVVLEKERDQLKRDSAVLDEKLQALYAKREKHRTSIKVTESELAALNLRSFAIKVQETRMKVEMGYVVAQENPFEAEQRKVNKDVMNAKIKIATLKKNIKDLEVSQGLSRYWIKGFKEVRLFLISNALAQFELEANNALVSLGLPSWKIEFAVDSVNKSGTVRKGFSALVKSPHTDAPVPWEAWSGGESQRLRLATAMGLSNLILSSTGATFDLEIWDEPSTWLNSQGIQDLLETLRARAIANNKRIWVLDHRALAFGGFAGIAKVVKSATGSHIEWGN